MSQSSDDDLLPQVGDSAFRAIVVAGALMLAVGVGYVRFCGEVDLPPKPPRPRETAVRAADVVKDVSATEDAYAAYLERDAKTYGIADASIQTMSKKFNHRVDDATYTLDPKRAVSLDLAGLRLSATQRTEQGERLLILSIENRTSTPLAYRIDTEVTKGGRKCIEKTNLLHNAMVVAPGATERRSECGYVKGAKLTITRVETLALSPLAAAYVSAVPPTAVLLDARSTKGHRPIGVELCGLIPPQSLAKAVSDGTTSWRDLIDFYARHRCLSYRFPEGYKAFTADGEHSLPVGAP